MLHPPLSAAARCIAVLLLTISLLPAAAHGTCAAASGARTTVLVELYTALACEGCPHADRWLADLARRHPPQSVAPLVFHVRGADYTSAGHATEHLWRRERRLLPRQRLALAYTPRVLLQGVDFPAWREARFDRAVEQAAALPARARLALAILGSSNATLRVRVEAAIPQARAGSVYLAAFQPREAVPTAFEWTGPFGLGRQEVELALTPEATADGSGVAGFVEDSGTAEVLQALILAPCRP